MSRRLAATLAAMACAIAAATPAAAAEGPEISQAGNPSFPERAYSLRTPTDVALSGSDIHVSENGQPVDGVGLASATDAGNGEFGTVLVIDASKSMHGEAIAGAMEAAQAFADRRTPQQELGVVTFNRKVDSVLPLTTNEASIRGALSEQPKLAPSTHLYDAVGEGVRELQQAQVKNGSVVVLSDGLDTGSAATLEQTAALARDAGVRVFGIGLQSSRFDRGALRQLSVDGTYADARNPKQLSGVFDAIGAELAREYLVTYRSQAQAGERVTVEMSVDGISGTARAAYAVAPPAGTPQPSPEQRTGFWHSTAAMIGSAALAALLLALGLVVIVRPRRKSLPERLTRFVSVDPEADEAQPARRSQLLSRFEEAVEDQPRWAAFIEELDVAQIEVPAVQIAFGTAIATVLAAVLIGMATGLPILTPLSLLVPLAVRGVIRHRAEKRRREFADQLADNLQVVASAIRAGHSMVGAFSVMVDEASEPSRSEFRQIVNDERLGVPLEEAVRRVGRRMDNRDLDQVALVATIQRETGGNTAEILDRVVQTIRQRGELRRLMETMTAQGRFSRVVVTAIPPLLLIAISLINPEYLRPLFHTGTGNVLLGLAVALVVAGSLVIKRMVNVKV
jgi:tight adherence protein B